jgi:hypothetical protein
MPAAGEQPRVAAAATGKVEDAAAGDDG